MLDKRLLLMIDSEPLRQTTIEEMLKTSDNIHLQKLQPDEVEKELGKVEHGRIAAIIIDYGVFVDRLFYGGVQLIQRLRSIHRLHCSTILISPDNNPSDSILDYSGHFFLPRFFQEEQFLITLEQAMNTRLSEGELQEIIDKYCLPELITVFQSTIIGHGISNLRGSARFALNGKEEETESRLNKCLEYLRELRQRNVFTELTTALDSRFEEQLSEINQVFDQMRCSLEDALNAVRNSAFSDFQKVKSEFNEKLEANPFVNAANRLKAVLLDVEEQLKV